MPVSSQVLKKIKIVELKGLMDVEINFTLKNLTAIMGPNGSGKSTILHALACVNNPLPGRTVNHLLSEFFTPTTHSTWTGSSFQVYQDYRDGANVVTDHHMHFRKQASRWAPRYVRRIQRYVSFIGVRTAVPVIESETQRSRIRFNTTALGDDLSVRVREAAGMVMNRNYTSYNSHQLNPRKKYIGVTTGGIGYSSLTMGAGEQRIFYILAQLFATPNYGLILIDEIDLLLHHDALVRLLEKINEIAQAKHLQVIFTTHAHAILDLDFVHFVHLYQTPGKTLAFTETKPDTLQRLTGVQTRPLEIFVEDDLALHLVKKVSAEEQLARHVAIKEYGAAINCFTTAAGAILNGLDNLDNMLFVLDGDEYPTPQDKEDKLKRMLTGDTAGAIAKRQTAMGKIAQFQIPAGLSPEKYYHSLIVALDEALVSPEEAEIIQVARQIVHPNDSHQFLDDIIDRMDFLRPVGITKLVDLLAKTPQWPNIKTQIAAWLVAKRPGVVEN